VIVIAAAVFGLVSGVLLLVGVEARPAVAGGAVAGLLVLVVMLLG
jgi:hypothetical protein